MSTSRILPDKIKKAPGRLKTYFNTLRDFVVSRDIKPGKGVVEQEFEMGRVFSVSEALQALEYQYLMYLKTLPQGTIGGGPGLTGGGGSITNIFNSNPGDSETGTGLPDVETDPETGEPTHNGQPLGWQTLNVCVDDGLGSYTPMVMDIYATAPYTPE